MLRLRLLVGLLTLMVWVLVCCSVQAQYDGDPRLKDVERIRFFDVEVNVLADGALEVTERIVFDVKGHTIHHGIYRDLPTTAPDARGKTRRVPFKLRSIKRNGEKEPYSLEWSGTVRSYKIGDGDIYLAHGEQVYEIRYRYERVLHFLDNGVRLRWDVTGNEWDFPIERAVAVVNLPQPVAPDQMRLHGYTGGYREVGGDFAAEAGVGRAVFSTTRALGKREGFTLELTLPPGVIAAPTAGQLKAQRLADLRPLFVGLFGLLIVGVYYLLAWLSSGVDPRAGAIVPLFEPPDDLPPAALRYLRRMRFDITALTATLISMGRKGYLAIEEDMPGHYILRRGEAGLEALSDDEQSVAKALFKGKTKSVEVDRDNHEKLGAAKSALASWLALRFGRDYYRPNTGLIVLGWLFSIGAVLAMFLAPDGFELLLLQPYLFGIIPVMLGVNLLFVRLLPAYTERARALLDLIEGFRVALSYKGKAHWPGDLMNAEMFERYLPYAIALDVETEFARGFQQAMELSGRPQQSQQQPYWYRSPWQDGFRYDAFSRSLGRNFNSCLGSASTPPSSSSSGGGGGFSGGGGGGGGGRGW